MFAHSLTRRILPRLCRLTPALAAALLLNACAVQQLAVDRLGDALADGGQVFASDDDPRLIRDASPFSLKLVESLLAQRPQHPGLSLAACRGFTQYSYAFVQQQADETEAHDLDQAFALRERARRLYRRARDYGLRSLEIRQPGITAALRDRPREAVAGFTADDAARLYWTGAAWAALLSLSKDDPDAVADLSAVSAIMDRALTLDPDFDDGALQSFMVTYAMARPDPGGDRIARAEAHFERAVALSGGQQASPYLALAESVAIATQDRARFSSLLETALAIDADAAPQWRLSNLVMQRRARWLLGRTDELFVD